MIRSTKSEFKTYLLGDLIDEFIDLRIILSKVPSNMKFGILDKSIEPWIERKKEILEILNRNKIVV